MADYYLTIGENPIPKGTSDRVIVIVSKRSRFSRRSKVLTVGILPTQQAAEAWGKEVVEGKLWIGGREPADGLKPYIV